MLSRRIETRSRSRRGNKSLWFRLLSYSAFWTVFALMLGGYLLSLTFKETVENNFDKRLNGLLESLIGISTSDTEGQISFYRAMVDPRFEQPYSGFYWQISARDQEPFRSRSLWDQSLEPVLEKKINQTRFSNVQGPEAQELRMAERDISFPGDDTIYRFIVAIDRAEIESEMDRFDSILIYSLSALGLGLIAASLLQVHLGLKPLSNIRRSLAEIRSGRAGHLPEDFPTEIQPLADEMNALLDHNNQIVDRSRTQVGNLAHALKTPLAILQNESALQDGLLADVVRRQTEMMRRQVDHYLRRARVVASNKLITSRTAVMPALRDITRAMTMIYKNKTFTVEPDTTEFFFRGERQDLEEMVGNLIENAAKWAACDVSVSCKAEGARLVIEVADDGPGVDKAVREAVFRRGERLDEEKPGTGLGLSIVKELSGLYGGEIILLDNHPHGLLARLYLPALISEG